MLIYLSKKVRYAYTQKKIPQTHYAYCDLLKKTWCEAKSRVASQTFNSTMKLYISPRHDNNYKGKNFEIPIRLGF